MKKTTKWVAPKARPTCIKSLYMFPSTNTDRCHPCQDGQWRCQGCSCNNEMYTYMIYIVLYTCYVYYVYIYICVCERSICIYMCVWDQYVEMIQTCCIHGDHWCYWYWQELPIFRVVMPDSRIIFVKHARGMLGLQLRQWKNGKSGDGGHKAANTTCACLHLLSWSMAKLLPAARRPCRTANEVIISGTVLPFASAVVRGEASGTRGAKFF